MIFSGQSMFEKEICLWKVNIKKAISTLLMAYWFSSPLSRSQGDGLNGVGEEKLEEELMG